MARNETDAVSLVDLRPTTRDRWSALIVAGVLLVGFVALTPFANKPLSELNAFNPSMNAIIFITDLITSVLLFAQFPIYRSSSILVLASGYLFAALIVIPLALTLPGAFSPTGLLGAGLQTRAWLYIFWHVGFAGALLVYAVLKDQKQVGSISEASALSAIGWTVASVIGLVCILTWFAIAEEAFLPQIILDKTLSSPSVFYPVAFAILISGTALATLWVRRRSVLDQWLVIVALVLISDLAFTGLLSNVRFSLGVYAGRVFSLVTSSIVLIVLLAETTRLHVLLARSNAMLRRERENKLININAVTASIAHEVKQPLAAITANGNAGLRWLARGTPDLEETRASLERIVNDAHRAGDVIETIRSMFKKGDQEKLALDINVLIAEVLALLHGDLRRRRISVEFCHGASLPEVLANRVQLQQVILNLLVNAAEAMDSTTDRDRVLRVTSDLQEPSGILITVEDSGPGMEPKNIQRIFEPFYTTKPGGMGMGLAICRSIIESHEGRLSAAPGRLGGLLVQISLPASAIGAVRKVGAGVADAVSA